MHKHSIPVVHRFSLTGQKKERTISVCFLIYSAFYFLLPITFTSLLLVICIWCLCLAALKIKLQRPLLVKSNLHFVPNFVLPVGHVIQSLKSTAKWIIKKLNLFLSLHSTVNKKICTLSESRFSQHFSPSQHRNVIKLYDNSKLTPFWMIMNYVFFFPWNC